MNTTTTTKTSQCLIQLQNFKQAWFRTTVQPKFSLRTLTLFLNSVAQNVDLKSFQKFPSVSVLSPWSSM